MLFSVEKRAFSESFLPEPPTAQADPSSGTITGPGSTLDKEIELFSKEPSILFDLSEVSQVNSRALNLNLPFSSPSVSSTSTFSHVCVTDERS